MMTINDAADALAVSRRTVYSLIAAGALLVDPSEDLDRRYRLRVRSDSPAFLEIRSRKVDKRTAWRLAAKARRQEAA